MELSAEQDKEKLRKLHQHKFKRQKLRNYLSQYRQVMDIGNKWHRQAALHRIMMDIRSKAQIWEHITRIGITFTNLVLHTEQMEPYRGMDHISQIKLYLHQWISILSNRDQHKYKIIKLEKMLININFHERERPVLSHQISTITHQLIEAIKG